MNKIAISSVTNANVYQNGANLLGRAMEITLPTLKTKMVEHKGLGMAFEVEIPAGGFEKLETKFKWASFYREVQRATGNPRKAVQLQVRASIEEYTGQGLTREVGLTIALNGVWKESPLGSLKQHESLQPESTLAVYYLKVVADGAEIVEVDVMNNIFKVAEEDVLSQYRRLIGG